jgi:hypothetical protein
MAGFAQSRRSEKRVFSELAALCISPGYAHALAYLCYRDNIVRFAGEMTADDMSHVSSMQNLSRAEIATLIGLMVKVPIDYSLPKPSDMQRYIDETDALLRELHEVMSFESFQVQDWKKLVEEGGRPFQKGQTYREPIYYGGESAYNFQYLDLARRKYELDNDWLERTKGFRIEAAQAVVRVASVIHGEKLQARLEAMRKLPLPEWTMLPAHLLNASEIAERAGVNAPVVQRVLESFCLPDGERNQAFAALDDFNVANALPLLRFNESEYLIFQTYSLAEALYEAPFYWMNLDRAYRGTAGENRGRFAEEFSSERLQRVFGEARVHTNVDVYESKSRKLSEIDVLVVFGDRAIVLQAKAKRLTLKARKGDDQAIRSDFEKSVQDAYDQGFLCASALTDTRCTFVDATGTELGFDRTFKEVYILCVVADHYPALSFQSRAFLKHQQTDVIKPPMVLDVFALDAITEMLASPLRFLSYLHRRTMYADRVHASELTILSYHLKQNLWLDDEQSMMALDEGLSADLDIAMAARRDGISGKTTPEGILTRYAGTTWWHLVEDIEQRADAGTIELGLMLLMLSGEAIEDTNRGIDLIVARTRRDGKVHDLTMLLGDSGFTVHCSDLSLSSAVGSLRRHCERRKYMEKSASWFGVCLGSRDARMRFGVSLDYRWKQDADLDEATKDVPKARPSVKAAIEQALATKKVGRNEPCPCGSGRKYKKCCMA